MTWKMGKGKGVKFSKDKKENFQHSDSPGPGCYEQKGETEINKEKGKGMSLYFRHKVSAKDNFPGPGSYKTIFELCSQQKQFLTTQI